MLDVLREWEESDEVEIEALLDAHERNLKRAVGQWLRQHLALIDALLVGDGSAVNIEVDIDFLAEREALAQTMRGFFGGN